MYLNVWMRAFIFCFLMTLGLLRNLVPFSKKEKQSHGGSLQME